MRRIAGIKDSLKTAFSSRSNRGKKNSNSSAVPNERPSGTTPPRDTSPNVSTSAAVPVTQTPDPDGTEPKLEPKDLWMKAYQDFAKREPELAADYTRHLSSFRQSKSTGEPGRVGTGESPEAGVQTALSDVASVELFMQQLLIERENKQWRLPLLEKDIKIRVQVEKLTKFLLWSDGIVKTALSAQPYAGLAWSGVSMLLPLISSGKLQHDAMLKGFESISHLQMYWRIYEEENPVHKSGSQRPEALRSIANLYSYIVEYQARVICHLSSAQLSRTWQKISDSNGWEKNLIQINELNERCKLLVSEAEKAHIQRQQDLQLRQMQESQAILNDIKKEINLLKDQTKQHYESEAEHNLLHDLATDYQHYKNINPLRVSGTCGWLLNDEGFRQWRATDDPGLLWISAGPGSGKSVLTRCLIDEGLISTTVTSNVCYFFFHTGTEGHMDNCSALASMLHQIFTQDSSKELIKIGLEFHKNHGDKLRRNFTELWRLLLACANANVSGEIICVLDALDECSKDDRDELLRALDMYFTMHASRSKIKFLITSRPYMDLEDAFREHMERPGYVRVDGDDKTDEIAQEINLTIDMKVKELARDLNETHRQILAKRLKSFQNRTYLWLHLTFDIIKRRRAAFSKLSTIQSLLDSIPSQVSDAYETILSHNSEDQNLVLAILQIVLAAARPLTLQEANYALTLASENGYFKTHDLIEDKLWSGDVFKSVVKDLSGLFITVSDSRLSFIHLTAREFLIDSTTKGNWRGRVPMVDSHGTMASICLEYLNTVDFNKMEERPSKDITQFPFMPYSLANWPLHYKSQVDEKKKIQYDNARKLCGVSIEAAEQLITIYCRMDVVDLAHDEFGDHQDLNLACVLGVEPVVRGIIGELDVDSDEYIPIYTQALGHAVQAGHADVVTTILKSTTNPEAHRELDSQSFGVAVISRHPKVMEAILDTVEDVHIVDEEVTLFGMAIGNKAIVSILLDRLGEEIKITENVLEMAATNNQHGFEIMETLLEKRGNDFHLSEAVVDSAVKNTSVATDILSLLLKKRGDEVQITDGILKSSISNMGAGTEIMELLLRERGDQIQITEDMLVAAAGNPRCGLKLMELFLEHYGLKVLDLVSQKVVDSAANNRGIGDRVMSFLHEKLGQDLPVSSTTMEIAATNFAYAPELISLIFDLDNSITLSTKALMNAAKNSTRGLDAIRMLLERRGSEIQVTDELLAAARTNEELADGVTSVLLEHRNRQENTGLVVDSGEIRHDGECLAT